MSLDEIDILAKKGGKPSEDFTGADSCYFWTMKSIYALYALRKIDVQTAKSEKLKARQNHTEHTRDKQLAFDTYKQMQDNIRATNGIRADVDKCEDIKECVRLLAKAVSLLTGDNMVYKNVEKKFL